MEKKKILLIIFTHGDEKIGLEIVRGLKAKGLAGFFDYLVANPRAAWAKERFVDVDLNRSYPGKEFSSLYEQRKAYENLRIVRKYRYIIDIHEASQGRDDFIIVPKEGLPQSFPLNLIALEKVLLWPDPKGPISQVLENAIELEFGMKYRNRKQAISKAEKLVEDFIRGVRSPQKSIYYVYGKLMKGELEKSINSLRDFRKTENDGEEFYPLLVGQYLKYGILCYKMRKKGKKRL